ncbi:MAG TPA: hypothetical protein PK370_03445 [Candidatus Woesebacteria bacterium]|nr:hypothetical protein [Candidatus Woesebacteria bacterium]
MKSILALISTSLLVAYLNLVYPQGFLSIFTLFVIIFLCLFSIGSIFIKSIKNLLILSGLFLIIFLLKFFNLLNTVNLIIAILLAVLIYRAGHN